MHASPAEMASCWVRPPAAESGFLSPFNGARPLVLGLPPSIHDAKPPGFGFFPELAEKTDVSESPRNLSIWPQVSSYLSLSILISMLKI